MYNLFFLLMWFGVTATAKAQEAPLNSDEAELLQMYGGQEMISVATGAKQPVGKAPAVTSVVTAEDIKAIGATDIDEALETVPGLHVARSKDGYNPIYSFRGVSSEYNPQVLMLVNGIPITNAYAGAGRRPYRGGARAGFRRVWCRCVRRGDQHHHQNQAGY